MTIEQHAIKPTQQNTKTQKIINKKLYFYPIIGIIVSLILLIFIGRNTHMLEREIDITHETQAIYFIQRSLIYNGLFQTNPIIDENTQKSPWTSEEFELVQKIIESDHSDIYSCQVSLVNNTIVIKNIYGDHVATIYQNGIERTRLPRHIK